MTEPVTAQEQAFLTWHDATYGADARSSLMLDERRMIFLAGWEAALPYLYHALQDAMAMIGRGISFQTGQSANLWSRLLRLPAPKKRPDA